MLQSDIDLIINKIKLCTEILGEFREKGLYTLNDLEQEAAKPNPSKEILRALKET